VARKTAYIIFINSNEAGIIRSSHYSHCLWVDEIIVADGYCTFYKKGRLLAVF